MGIMLQMCRNSLDAEIIAKTKTSISAAELNYIIYRYLQESGFRHAAFNLRFEADINIHPTYGDSVPPAALVKLVQAGLQLKEMEANAENNADDEDFYFLPHMDLITKDVSELQKIVKEKKRNPSATGPKDLGTSSHVKDKAGKSVRFEEGKERVVGRRSERLRRKYN